MVHWRPYSDKGERPRETRGARRPLVRVLGGLALVFVSLQTFSCAAVLGFEDATDLRDGSVADRVSPAPDGTATATPPDAGDGDGDRAGNGDVDAFMANPPPPPPAVNPCDASSADPAAGIFVTPMGTNAAGCGAASAPCASIQVGILQAQTLGKTVVFLGSGTYSEWVTLPAGITLAGGWTPQWTASTDTDAAGATIAPASNNVSVLADAIDGGARVCRLTIASKPAAAVQRGESVYGVFVRGPSTSVELDDVVVQVVTAGDGIPGVDGDAGAAGAAGGCSPPGTGQNGGPTGATGSPARDAGGFSRQGFVPGTGATGGAGAPGDNGKLGATGACVACVTCGTPSCAAVDAGVACGLAGPGGCGGGGASGGAGGGGGGGSIGIFVWGGGTGVTLSNCVLSAGNGGAGALGGNGGNGGAGAKAAPGQDALACTTTCSAGTPCATTNAAAAGGSGGGTGGNGSRGGAGGAGAGGSSCAIAQGGGAGVMNQSGTTLIFGKAGRGAGAATDGTAGSVCF